MRSLGERRFLTLGLLEDQVVSVAHNERGDVLRIIVNSQGYET